MGRLVGEFSKIFKQLGKIESYGTPPSQREEIRSLPIYMFHCSIVILSFLIYAYSQEA
jgi:hypothetical protein